MKKIFFFISALLMFLTHGNSQNTTPYWSLAGNSNAASTSKLGTTNNVSLRFYTNNVQRVIINSAAGYVGIGTSSPVNILTVKSSGGTPAASWLNGLNSPVFVGFGETVSSELLLAGASNTDINRAVFQGRRSRGTLAAPKAVANNDYITSLLASAYDGSTFQNPALVSFFVDGTPSAGNVPTRISLITGSNAGNRTERLKVGSTGDFNFNNGQLTLKKTHGLVGIGINSPIAQLDVRNAANINSLYVTNTSTNSNQFGVRSSVNGVNTASFRTAGEFLATGGGSNNTGLTVLASAANVNYGGNFNATDGATSNIAVWGNAGGPGGSTNYAVYGSIAGFSSGNDFAGYFAGRTYVSTSLVVGTSETPSNASVTIHSPATTGNSILLVNNNSSGNGIQSNYSGSPLNYYAVWGIAPASGSNQAGYFSGNVTVSGTFSNPSDERLKEDIKPLTGVLDKLMKVSVNTYNFKSEYSSMNLPQGKQYGYLAQNVESIFPELVKNTADKTKDQAKPFIYKTVNYIGMVPILTKALQEEHEQRMKTEEEINILKADNEALKTKLENIELAISKLSLQTQTNATGENAKLDQNSPNPFSKKSTITCYIPESSKRSMIVVYTIDGKAVKTFNNLSKGFNRIEIVPNTLAAGVYNYTLFVDNKAIESRQMVLAR